MATSGSFNTSGYDGRYLTFAWSVTSQNIQNNTTTISWTLTAAGGNVYNYYQARNIKVTIDGNVVYSFPQANGCIELSVGTVAASGTYTFTHNADGTRTFTAYAEAGIYNWAVNCTGSGAFALDTIKRRSVVSGSNGTLGSANTLTLTRYNSAFTDTITATCGTASMTIATGNTSGSVKWTPPLSWASQNVSATSVTAKISCKTYNGSTLLGETTVTLTFAIPASVVPTVSLTVSDATSYRTTYGSYIQNKSQAKVTATGAGVYGSSIKSYTIVCGSLSGTGASGTFKLPSSGTVTIKVTATDSRGRSASASTTISVTAYSAPTANITSRYRCDAQGNEDYLGTYAIAVFKAAVTSLGGKNSASYALKYRVRGTTAWTSISMTSLTGNYAPSGVSQIFPAGIDNSYDVCIAVTDNFGTIESAYRTIQMASPIMDVDRSKRSVAFFQRAVDANTVAFGQNVKFNAGLSVTNASDAAAFLSNLSGQGLFNGDYNTNFTPGIYWSQLSQCTNTPLGDNVSNVFGFLEVWKPYPDATFCIQRFTRYNTGDSWFRSNVNDDWKSWFLQSPTTPAMAYGTEYALAEYCNGSQVYAKWVNFGALPNNTYKSLSIGVSREKIVSITGIAQDSTNKAMQMLPTYHGGEIGATFFVNSSNLLVVEAWRDMTAWTGVFLLKYTK